jgi:hypothetical protein
MRERLKNINIREIADWPEYAAMAIGASGLILAITFPEVAGGVAPASMLLLTGGAVSLAVTRAIWPKKGLEKRRLSTTTKRFVPA